MSREDSYFRRDVDEKKPSENWQQQTPSANAGGQLLAPCGIGWAVKQLYHGLKVRRRSWNEKGMWLALQVPDINSKMSIPYVYIHTAHGSLVPWTCSQMDLLSHDWEVALDESETER